MATQEINDWVNAQTDGLIPSIVPLLSPATRMVLTNAILFRAAWAEKFENALSYDEDFYGVDAQREVSMMHRYGPVSYFADDTYQAVELAYDGFDLSMVILLPNEMDGLPALDASLNTAMLDRIFAGLDFTEVNLSLPRWEFEPPIMELNEALQNMGMQQAFGLGANFSGISSGSNLSISAVAHRTYIRVAEGGTEAAGATAVIMVDGGCMPDASQDEPKISGPISPLCI